jgi:hypothetical protein
MFLRCVEIVPSQGSAVYDDLPSACEKKLERRIAALEFCDPPAAGSIGCDQWKNVWSI